MLIELLIALAILSIVFFYLAPVSVNFFKKSNDKNIEQLDTAVTMAYKKARQTGMPQIIWGVKGSNNIHFDGKLIYISNDVFDVKVNGSYQYGDEYYFFVYPNGVMDRVSMILFGNIKLYSFPLLLRFGS